jgi:dynein heavy chain
MVICGAYDMAVKMMSDSGFLSALLNFPKEQINDETVELLQPYFAAPDFNYDSARKASGNVAGGCWCWCWLLLLLLVLPAISWCAAAWHESNLCITTVLHTALPHRVWCSAVSE